MGLQLGLPAALKARGLTVEVIPGWDTRSAGSFAPRGAVCHWTAGPAGTFKRPSLSICTNGRADLPGPLCNVYLDRNGVAVVVAAGRANHAGAGTWRGVTGNSSFFGTECEAAGLSDFTKAQRWAYPRVNAAYCDLGRFGADMVCGHSEYATPKGRKSDINGYTMDDMRADVASVLAGRATTSPVQEDDMPLTNEDVEKVAARVWSWVSTTWANDSTSKAGDAFRTIDNAVGTTNGNVLKVLERLGAPAAAAQPVQVDAASVAAALAADAGFRNAISDSVADKLAQRLQG